MKKRNSGGFPDKPNRTGRTGHNIGVQTLNVGSEYTEDEVAVLKAVDAFRSRTGRRFPSVIDIFSVIKALGYRK